MEGIYWGNYVTMNFQYVLVATTVGTVSTRETTLVHEDNINKRMLFVLCVIMILFSVLVFGTKIRMNSTFAPF